MVKIIKQTYNFHLGQVFYWTDKKLNYKVSEITSDAVRLTSEQGETIVIFPDLTDMTGFVEIQ